MAIYDCFQFFNEEHTLDLRFNILNEFVDFFIIVESTSDHQGNPKKLNFDSKKLEYILYRQDVLKENNEQSTDADWELISIHAIPEGVDKLPMGPVTMMRNQLELKGGTKANYSSEEWAEAVRFWQNYAALEVSE